MSFSISDSGVGFNTKDIPFLFSKFYQGDLSRSNQLHHGLGLYIVEKLVKKHGGEIHAENNEIQGACISFTIHSLLVTKKGTMNCHSSFSLFNSIIYVQLSVPQEALSGAISFFIPFL